VAFQRARLDDDREHPVQVRPPVAPRPAPCAAAFFEQLCGTAADRAFVPFLRRSIVAAVAVMGLVASGGIAGPRVAGADEIAPELETLELRQKARAEAKRLLGDLAPSDRHRLVGLYVAFDPDAADPGAMVACDDDGDYVVVVTDAMLRLVSIVARAQSDDESNGTHGVEDYASFLAVSQVSGRRLLPPPPGFYPSLDGGIAQESRLREALSFVLARELAHLRGGDLACPHPTATHENGDDVWTASERRRALEGAASVYPGRAIPRDEEATRRVLDAGRTELGALALLHFFAQLETQRGAAESRANASRFTPTYLAQHPSASARAATVKAAARNHRGE
jgi:hypothetical protein